MLNLRNFPHLKKTLLSCTFLLVSSAQANLVISGTRFIYPEGEKAITVDITNPDSYPALAQSWMETTTTPNPTTKIPFIITPALTRVEPSSKHSLRILHTGETLDSDKESLFYLNILDVPAKPKSANTQNYLQFTFKNRLKFFYRPKGLPYTVDKAYDKVTWHLNNNQMTIKNETPYYITYVGFELFYENQYLKNSFTDADMLAPFSQETIAINPSAQVDTADAVKWYVINDHGGTHSGTSKLTKNK